MVGSVIFSSINTGLFRWRGEYTWVARGPMVEGISEIMPLPSTLIGALIAINAQSIPMSSQIRKHFVPNDQLDKLRKEVFNCDNLILRGPYYVSGENEIFIHNYNKGLVRLEYLSERGFVITEIVHRDEFTIPTLNTAVRMDNKSAVEHLLYATSMIDLSSKQFNVLLEIHDCSCTKTLRTARTAPLGGDSHLSIIKCDDRQPIYEKIRELTKELNKNEIAAYTVTPVLFDPIKFKEVMKMNKSSEAELKIECNFKIKFYSRKRLCSDLGLYELCKLDDKNLWKIFRPQFSLLAPGFDILRENVRPIYVALMPGSILVIEMDNYTIDDIYKNGISCINEKGYDEVNKLGWGTIVPLNGLELKKRGQ